MSSFIYSVFRGFYPPYILFVVWGVAARIRARRWRPFDTLLLAAFLIFEFFAAFQVWMFYGKLETVSRYMLIAVPLCLPFAAEGVLGAWDILKNWRLVRLAAPAVCVVLLALVVYNFYSPVVKLNSARGKLVRRKLSVRAAAWIREDWRGRPSRGIDRLKCDQYHSGKRPLVQARDGDRVGLMCGGQGWYAEIFAGFGIPPDYIIRWELAGDLPDYVLAATLEERGRTVYIYRRRTGGGR